MTVPIQLVLADVDGTLVTRDKILTPRAIRAVHALKERGIRFAVTSGRPPRGMAMLVEPLALELPLAGFNGGVMVHPDWSVIEIKRLSPAKVETILKLIRDRGADPWIYTSQDWFVTRGDAPHVLREQETVKFSPRVDNVSRHLNDVVKITGVSDDRALMIKLERELQETLGRAVSAACSQPYYVDVTHCEANKGGVVSTLESLFDIPAAAMVTFGDQPNDILMFEKSGMSIAMGQASKAVQKAATYVSKSCEEDGFAHGIERFVLGNGDSGA